jgi:D-3-phosphoglycerate dehydrogenase
MAKLTVFVTDYTIAEEMDLEQDLLKAIDAEIVRAQCQTEEEVAAQIGDPDLIITQWAPLPRAILAKLTKCKAICRNGVGVDNIDLAACKELGIAVLNVPAYSIPEVADQALALTLTLLRGIQPTIDFVRGGGWGETPVLFTRRLCELNFGVIGLGRIGRASAARAKPFFKKVIGYDPYLPAGATVENVDEIKGSYEELFSEADCITLHVPLSDETRGLVNAEKLAMMKPTAFIVNTCRGPVVNTNDLVDALKAGKIAGAGLDVHDPEPLPADHPLRSFPNVVITPHVAYFSQDSVLQARRETAENLVLFVQGKKPISRLV